MTKLKLIKFGSPILTLSHQGITSASTKDYDIVEFVKNNETWYKIRHKITKAEADVPIVNVACVIAEEIPDGTVSVGCQASTGSVPKKSKNAKPA